MSKLRQNNQNDSAKTAVDIKYINVPNICFSLTNKDDDREELFSKQRIERGFDDSETWSLTDTICHFILPRLKRFKECGNGIPAILEEEEWNEILDKMILALKLTSKDKGSRIWTDEEEKQVDEGLDLFREWFMALWW